MSDSAPSSLEIFTSTAPGLESIAAGELKALGIRAKQEIGGVTFTGDFRRVYEANLWLRTASRITVRLGRFHASTFFELERRARKLPWGKFLPATGPVRLRVTCRKSKLYHSDAVAERILSAIDGSGARGVTAENDSPDDDAVDTGSSGENPSQLFIVRIFHDECEISADSSGELLHRRGYRQEVGKAPLRETIAAAMVLASGWKRESRLLDPMCGSGTIPIEAAMLARNIAPGLERKFQFMNWPGFSTSAWNEMLERARGAVTRLPGEILGADRDEGAIAAARRNAERAGVIGNVSLSTEPLSGSLALVRQDPHAEQEANIGAPKRTAEGGWILTNPPYGIRVASGADLRDLYATLGSAIRVNPAWRLGVLTSDAVLVRQSQLKLVARFSTSNGGIPVAFFVSAKAPSASAQRSRATLSKGVDGE